MSTQKQQETWRDRFKKCFGVEVQGFLVTFIDREMVSLREKTIEECAMILDNSKVLDPDRLYDVGWNNACRDISEAIRKNK